MKDLVSVFVLLCSVWCVNGQSLLYHWKLDETAASPGFGDLGPGGVSLSAAVSATVGSDAAWVKQNTADPGPAYGATGLPALGNALGVSARDARIELGSISPRLNAFTMSFWFHRLSAPVSGHDDGGDQEHILSSNGTFSQAGRWNLITYNFVPGSEVFDLYWFHDSGVGGTGLQPVASGLESDEWYHVAITRDAGNLLSVYVNGQLGLSMPDTGDLTNAFNGVILGTRNSSISPTRILMDCLTSGSGSIFLP